MQSRDRRNSANAIGKVHPKALFTKQEDEQLVKIVNSLGKKTDWNIVSSMMKNRNSRQCRDRWMNYLSPSVNLSPFTADEDILLLEKYHNYGPRWVQISKHFNNRSDISLKSRFMVLKRRGFTISFIKAHKNDPLLKEACCNKKRKPFQKPVQQITAVDQINYIEKSKITPNDATDGIITETKEDTSPMQSLLDIDPTLFGDPIEDGF